MAYHIKPLLEPMKIYFQLDSWEQISKKVEKKLDPFIQEMRLKMSEMAANLSRLQCVKTNM